MTGVSFGLYSGNPRRHRTLVTSPKTFFNFLKEVRMDNDNFTGGYSVPIDPMDDLQCDSCQ